MKIKAHDWVFEADEGSWLGYEENVRRVLADVVRRRFMGRQINSKQCGGEEPLLRMTLNKEVALKW